MKKMSPQQIKAKLAVLEELMNMANMAEGDDLDGHFKGLNKVTVAAKDPEDLEAGLDKAKDLMEEMPQEPEMDNAMHEKMEEMPSETELSLPEKSEKDEEMLDPDMEKLKGKNLPSKKKKGYLSDLV